MEKLAFEFIDKIRAGYLIFYCSMNQNPEHECLLLPMSIYNWYIKAKENQSNTFKFKKGYKNGVVTITKKSYKNNNYMKLEFDNKYIHIPNSKFNKISKVYSFQAYIAINIYNGNGQLMCYNFRFLKSYNTRSKAIYFMEKFACRFASIYRKYFIDDNISGINNFELFQGDIIYEHNFIFREKYGNGTANYNFMIISVENE